METITNAQVDQILDDATLKQLAWKPGICRNVALRIVDSFLPDKIQWSDEINIGEIDAKDKNVIGCTWRRLAKMGIIKRMEGADDHRRSTIKSRRGSTIWKYRLADKAKAELFLKENGWTKARRGQPELPL